MTDRQRYLAVLLTIGIGWGTTQPLGKMATTSGHGPFGLIFWQLAICAAVLGAVTLLRGKQLVVNRQTMGFYIPVAILGTLVPNATFYLSASRLPSGVMSIIISAVPLLAFPMALALGMERFALMRLFGLLLGLAAVALLAGPGAALPDPAMAQFLPIALIGPVFYAMEGVYVARRGMGALDPVQAMFGASLVALVMCLPLALGTGQWFNLLAGFGMPEVALVLCSIIHAMMYAGYVWLASRAGAVFAAQCSYITTGAGILFAMMFLGERFSPFVWAALVLLLCGVALVTPRDSGKAAVA